VTERTLLHAIARAAEDEEGFLALRRLVFGNFEAEEDYVFEPGALVNIFDALLPYLQVEEAFGDEERHQRMRRLKASLEDEMTTESAIIGLEHGRAAALMEKFRGGLIDRETLEAQLRKLSPLKFDLGRLLKLYERSSARGQHSRES
jgi:hypothetical protein